jgi:hypothetical protein
MPSSKQNPSPSIPRPAVTEKGRARFSETAAKISHTEPRKARKGRAEPGLPGSGQI